MSVCQTSAFLGPNLGRSGPLEHRPFAGAASEETSGFGRQGALLLGVTPASSSARKIVPAPLYGRSRPQSSRSPCRRSPRARRREQERALLRGPLCSRAADELWRFTVDRRLLCHPEQGAAASVGGASVHPTSACGRQRKQAGGALSLCGNATKTCPSLPRRKWEADELRSFRVSVSNWSKTFLSFSAKLLTRFAFSCIHWALAASRASAAGLLHLGRSRGSRGRGGG